MFWTINIRSQYAKRQSLETDVKSSGNLHTSFSTYSIFWTAYGVENFVFCLVEMRQTWLICCLQLINDTPWKKLRCISSIHYLNATTHRLKTFNAHIDFLRPKLMKMWKKFVQSCTKIEGVLNYLVFCFETDVREFSVETVRFVVKWGLVLPPVSAHTAIFVCNILAKNHLKDSSSTLFPGPCTLWFLFDTPNDRGKVLPVLWK